MNSKHSMRLVFGIAIGALAISLFACGQEDAASSLSAKDRTGRDTEVPTATTQTSPKSEVSATQTRPAEAPATSPSAQTSPKSEVSATQTRPAEAPATSPSANVQAPVIAAFEASVRRGQAPLTVHFRNTSTGVERFEYDFGDGSGSVEKEPSHTFTKAGTFLVLLTTAAGERERSSASIVVTVDAGPLVKVVVSPADLDIVVDTTRTFLVEGTDAFGNRVPDLTFKWLVRQQAGSVDEKGVYKAGTKAGSHKLEVEVTDPRIRQSRFGSVAVRIKPGSLSQVVLMPLDVSVPAGATIQLKAEASDRFGNVLSDAAIAWRVVPASGKVAESGLLTATTRAGNYSAAITVTARSGSEQLDVTFPLRVIPGPLAKAVVKPATVTLDIGAKQAFAVEAFDEYDNTLPNVKVSWSLATAAGTVDANGVFQAGSLARTFAGVVRAETAVGAVKVLAQAGVEIRPDPLASLEVSPSTAIAGPGIAQQYSAIGYDQFRNLIPALAAISWEATGGQIDERGNFSYLNLDSGAYEVRAKASYKGAQMEGKAIALVGVQPPMLILRLFYDGKPLAGQGLPPPRVSLIQEGPWPSIESTWRANIAQLLTPNLASGSRLIQIVFDVDGNGWPLPGDLVLRKSIEIPSEPTVTVLIIDVPKVIRLTAPVDNAQNIGFVSGNISTTYVHREFSVNTLTFFWDAIPEAVSYRVRIEEWAGDSFTRIRTVTSADVNSSSWLVTLPANQNNSRYFLYVSAVNKDRKEVGHLWVKWDGAYNDQFAFRIRP